MKKYQITINGKETIVKSDSDRKISKKEAADMLKLHARYVGYLVGQLENTDASKIGSIFEQVFLAVMGTGDYPLDLSTDGPVSILFDLEEMTAFPVIEDGNAIPERLLQGFLSILVTLARFLYGEIDYVFFVSDIRKAFGEGVEEGKKEKEK